MPRRPPEPLAARIARRVRDLPASAWATRRLAGDPPRPPTRLDAASLRRVWVVRLDEIGDAVLTTPLLRALRTGLPDAEIAWVVRPALVPLARACPWVDVVHTFDPYAGPWALRGWTRQRQAQRLARTAHDAPPDLALLPRFGPDDYHAAQLAWLCGARVRIGFAASAGTAAAPGLAGLLTHALPSGAPRHERLRALQLLEPLALPALGDAPELRVDPEARRRVEARLGPRPAGVRLRVAVAPGAREARKCWPAERFAAVVRALGAPGSVQAVLLGAPGEAALARHVARRLPGPAIDGSGALDLGETAAALASCDLLLANDSGPMHMADALGTPVAAVSCHPRGGDPASRYAPERFGPHGPRSRLLQPDGARAPCTGECVSREAHCILGVPVDAVAEAARALLERGRA